MLLEILDFESIVLVMYFVTNQMLIEACHIQYFLLLL